MVRRVGDPDFPLQPADEARLRDLHFSCRRANFNNAKAFAFHWPKLLNVGDQSGQTALHFAAMSGSADFLEFMLGIYRDSRSFARWEVTYRSEVALCSDGLRLGFGGERSAAAVVVTDVLPRSIAACAGVRVGDGLEAARGERIVDGRAQPKMTVEDVFAVLEKGTELKAGAPFILRFCRPVHGEILSEDTWAFTEDAANDRALHADIIANNRRILRLLQKERQQLARVQAGLPAVPQRHKDARKEPTAGPSMATMYLPKQTLASEASMPGWRRTRMEADLQPTMAATGRMKRTNRCCGWAASSPDLPLIRGGTPKGRTQVFATTLAQGLQSETLRLPTLAKSKSEPTLPSMLATSSTLRPRWPS
eukprot:TRINITY_DN65416_c0_g1_i1.p1 TRINITY_DN65416_c0_g1~~TRINITY_DN65416_c0_g1_i1.p1  ORF type:complete len:376 (+),score=71.73 TRINITY_DN65416_c0_g1_i1:34-1128(+)